MLSCSANYSYSQKCGTTIEFNPTFRYDLKEVLEDNSLDNEVNPPIKQYKNVTINHELTFYVQFHIVTRDKDERFEAEFEDENGNMVDFTIDSKDINKSLERLNLVFLGANISFKEASPPKYIYSNKFAFLDKKQDNEFEQEISHKQKKDVINVYCFDALKIGQVPLNGYAFFPEENKDRIMMSYDGIRDKSALSHEFGHYFGLYHTHETEFGRESVDRENCRTTGDLICSTPADPNLRMKKIVECLKSDIESTNGINCSYNCSAKDSIGQLYNPLIDNIMSYAPSACRTSLTNGQYSVIRFVAKLKRNYLKVDKTLNSNNISTEDEIDNLKFPHESFLAAQNGQQFYDKKKDKVFILVYKDSIKWCERMLQEIRDDYSLNYYFRENYTFVLFNVGNRTTKGDITDFLDNPGKIFKSDNYFNINLTPINLTDAIHTNEYSNIEYNILTREFRKDIVTYPSVILLRFRSEENNSSRIVEFHDGYMKTREIKEMLERNLNR